VSTNAIIVSLSPAPDSSDAFVDVTIFTISAARADVAAALLVQTFSNLSTAGTELGVTVKQVNSAPAVSLPSSSSQLSDSAVAAIIVSVAMAVLLALSLAFVICKEKSGTPLFVGLDAPSNSGPSSSTTRANVNDLKV